MRTWFSLACSIVDVTRFALLVCLVMSATTVLGDNPGDGAGIDSALTPARRISVATEFSDDALQGPACVSVSSDGRFLYTAGYKAPSILVLEHNKEREQLDLVQTLADASRLEGTTSVRLSNDERFAVSASFQSSAVSLFSRDTKSGRLERLDTKQTDVDAEVSGLGFTVEANFSFDDQFVNVLDDRGGIAVFRITNPDQNPKLQFVEAFRHEDLNGARGLAHHPRAGNLFVACKKSNCLIALRQDAQSGKLTITDTKRDETDGVKGLHSAFGVAASTTGDFVYAISGQHGGGKDNAICVFRFDPFSGKLELLEELLPGRIQDHGELAKFKGGNEVRVDSGTLYACATVSGSIGVFKRNPTTGRLTMEQMLVDGVKFGWVSGLAIGPHGKYLYAACEKNSTICAFRRE